LGLSAVTGLDNWVAAQLTAAGVGNKGAKIISLLNDFSNMSTTDVTYGAAVTAFNTKIDAAQAFSQTSGNTGGTFTAAGTAGLTLTLTANTDVKTGGTGADTFDASTTTNSWSTFDKLDGGPVATH